MSAALPEPIQNQTILVVDDNAASLYATSRILRAAGFRVLEAVNGTDALALATEDIGLVVLDINLPDIDGLEVCRQLRARTYAAYLPIVHLSATLVTTDDMSLGLSAGADSYLTHPADPTVLVATVRTLLFARQSELVRRETDSRFRAVFELAASGIALLDAALCFTDANPAFCAIVGRERAEIIGMSLLKLIDSSQHETWKSLETLGEHARWEGILPVRRPHGSLAEIEWRLATESPMGVRIAIATDITERRRAEAVGENILAGERAARGEAERLNRVKDEFLATLSHEELRNPLTAIMGWVNVLRRTPGVNTEITRAGLSIIERNSRLQSHLDRRPA